MASQDLLGKKRECLQAYSWWRTPQKKRKKKNKIKPGRIEFVSATTTTSSTVRPDYSIFVGELTPEVDDFQLYDYFLKRYPSCLDCKIATDLLGYSRGYAYVRFGEQGDQMRALQDCQNAPGLGGKRIRLSIGISKSYLKQSNSEHLRELILNLIKFDPGYWKKNPPYEQFQYVRESTKAYEQLAYANTKNTLYDNIVKALDVMKNNYFRYWQRLKAEFQRYQSYNYNDYYQDYQNYYSQWNYDAYAEYNYNSYAAYDSMQAIGDCSLGDAVMAPAVFEESSAMAEMSDDLLTEDPQLYLDVDEMNRQFMETSEELYDSLMNCHWQPLDTVTSEIPSAI